MDYGGLILLRGAHSINLDAKGRLTIPTKYRAELEECCERQLVVTADRDGCLLLYPLPEWEKVEQELGGLKNMNKHAKALKRFIIGYATDCEMDAQGRVLLPETLRTFAKLDKHIRLIGQLNKFEIWDADVWASQQNAWLEGADDEEALPDDLLNLSF